MRVRSVLILLSLVGCNRPLAPEQLQPAPSKPAFAVEIREPRRLTAVELPDGTAQTVRADCVSCHSLRAPDGLPRQAGELKAFHAGLRVNHGELACASCHAPESGDRLRLASGERVGTREVMTLCAQCHGPQARDYRRGSHGGMSGHWDLSRGPRVRNNCTDCHDPHSPQFQGGHPVHPPRDRFLERSAHP
ncbi:MAG: hypothetical protein ACK4N5_04985 [Myxococcales bacterium]